jgi:hypothetical protein
MEVPGDRTRYETGTLPNFTRCIACRPSLPSHGDVRSRDLRIGARFATQRCCSMSNADGLTAINTRSATAIPGSIRSIRAGAVSTNTHSQPSADEELDGFGRCIYFEQLGVLGAPGRQPTIRREAPPCPPRLGPIRNSPRCHR